MKIPAFVSVVTTFALAAVSQGAITIAGNNLGGSGRILADAAGTPLPVGSLIRLGFFNDPVADAAVIASTNFSAIDAIFKSLGEGLVNSGTVATGSLTMGAPVSAPVAGRFSFSIQNVQQSYLPQDKLMFYWIFNSSSAASASEWAIFTNDDSSGGGAPWLSKFDDPGIPGSGDLSLAAQQLRVDDASDVITGTIVGDQLRTIPEPSLAALGLTATALLFRRRRS